MANFLYKTTIALLFSVLTVIILYYGKPILLPISVASLFTLLLMPIAQKLELIINNRTIASFLAVLFILVICVTIFLFFFNQLSQLLIHAPALKELILLKIEHLQAYIEKTTLGAFIFEITGTLTNQLPGLLDVLRATIRLIITDLRHIFFTLFLSLIYTFFLLAFRHKIHQLILLFTPSKNKQEAETTLIDIQKITISYVCGLLTVMALLMLLDSIGLYILGIPYPVLWGIMAGMVTIIPYIGVFIGGFFPLIMALLTDQPFEKAIAVIILFTIMQLLENNILTPYIIGAYIDLNPLFIFTCMLAGGLLWGIPGLILSIPLAAIIKTVLTHISKNKAYVTIFEINGKK